MTMKAIKDLNLGFLDAQNYTQRKNKQMLLDVFVKNDYLEELLSPNIYYLIGEKGTGKTAYAAFLNNNDYKETKSFLKFIQSTDYEKFHELKKKGLIDISGYADIWKTILLLLLAKNVTEEKDLLSGFRTNLSNLMQAIDEYYNSAFSPEINHALKIVNESGIAAKLVSKYAEIGGTTDSTVEFDEQRLQMNLYYIYKKFSDCLGKLKLAKNVILFIDGIDIRPSQIPYNEYLDCIKGLANACWSLNTELFANVKDSKGQFRIVLLLRPDIFNSLNLQNATNKLADNAVFLEWRTTYTDYLTSHLYKMACKLVAHNQDDSLKNNEFLVWEHYFNWKIESSNPEQRDNDTAFMEFLKISLSRPRDIQRILKIMQDIMKEQNMSNKNEFDIAVYKSDRFQNIYSEYFLSSLKDQLSFYYSEEDYIHFKKFFDFFEAPQFSFSEYESAYKKFENYILDNAKEIPKFVEDKKAFLQFLYDCNVVTAIEIKRDGNFFHFSYREKGPSNIAPEVLYGEEYSYRFHYGLYKKAKMGKYK